MEEIEIMESIFQYKKSKKIQKDLEEQLKKLKVENQTEAEELNKMLKENKDKAYSILTLNDYEAIKELYYYLLSNLKSPDDISKVIKEVYQAKKIEKYPKLNGIYRYPVLNELIGTYPEWKLVELDKVLSKIRYKYGYNGLLIGKNELALDFLDYVAGIFTEDELRNIVEFLHSKSVVGYKYTLRAEIDEIEYDTEISEKNYFKFKEEFMKPQGKRKADYMTLELYSYDYWEDYNTDDIYKIDTEEEFDNCEVLLDAYIIPPPVSEDEIIDEYENENKGR